MTAQVDSRSTIGLDWAARVLAVEPPQDPVQCSSVVHDSGQVSEGALFVAIRGERHDGHDFAAAAHAAGAVALLVERPLPLPLPQLVVADSRKALGELAAAWRRRFSIPLVALTGSNGKTTTREMIATILARRGPVLVTRGNLNNELGVPLTLLRLRPEHRCAVIEEGANHPGEIRYLTALSRPTVALVTNVGPAHLEGFGSLDGVAQAKGEIFSELAPGGVAVINRCEPYADLWQGLAAGRRCSTFALDGEGDLRGRWSASTTGGRLELSTAHDGCGIELQVGGRHNAANAVAATAAALEAGATLRDACLALADFAPVAGRLCRLAGLHGATVIDDSYNANPASLGAALEWLATLPGRRIVALGDMGELGGEAERLHRQVGEQARRLGIDALYATGSLSRASVVGFGAEAHHFVDRTELAAALCEQLDATTTVLVKGSRAAGMEHVVAALRASEEETCSTC